MNALEYKQHLLEELYKPYQKCKACPLGSLGRTTVVFGEGNPEAKIFFIGEGPGQEEDLQGRPFVGRSGKLLDKIFELVGITRSELFISNVVKCRPPNNRKPLPIESNTCKNLLLLKQIKIIQPRIICALGSAAVQALLTDDIKISQVRGTIQSFQALPLIPTYHPAYILRNPAHLETVVEDIRKVVELSERL